MDIAELPADAIQELYGAMALRQPLDRTREELRATDAGFHVETRRQLDPSHTTLGMPDAPERLGRDVITLRFA